MVFQNFFQFSRRFRTISGYLETRMLIANIYVLNKKFTESRLLYDFLEIVTTKNRGGFMKQIHYPLLVLIIQLAAANSHATLRTDIPKQKITLTEAQINAIKNERGRPSKEVLPGIFGEDNSEELEELLQARLREVSHLTYFRDHTSLDKAITFSGLALQAWNPELRHTDTKKMVIKNIINYGFIDGFVVPTMVLLNSSYAIENKGFGNLLNTMLSDIVPSIADNLKKQYGIPTEVNNQNFDQISKNGRQAMWNTLLSQLDPDFFKVHQETEKLLVDGRLKPRAEVEDLPIKKTIISEDQFDIYGASREYEPQFKEAKINDFINVNINGDKTAIAHYLKKIGKEDNSQKIRDNRTSGMNSTPTNTVKETSGGKFRGVFSSDRKVNAWECAFRCTKDVFMWGLGGVGGGALIGGPVGAAAMGTAGTVIGLDECSRHQLCGGDGTRRKKDEPKEQKENPPKKSEPKEPKAGDDDPRTIDTDDDDNEPSQLDEDSMTYPSLPSENGPKKIFTAGNKDLIMTVSVKEKTAQRKEVNVIYPTSPNNGD